MFFTLKETKLEKFLLTWNKGTVLNIKKIRLKEQLFRESINYLSGFKTKKVLIPIIKQLNISLDILLQNDYYLKNYKLLEKRTQLTWKIIRFHESEIIGSSRVPATVIIEKESTNQVLSFSFADMEYVDIFFKRFELLILDKDSGNSDSGNTDIRVHGLKPKI